MDHNSIQIPKFSSLALPERTLRDLAFLHIQDIWINSIIISSTGRSPFFNSLSPLVLLSLSLISMLYIVDLFLRFIFFAIFSVY